MKINMKIFSGMMMVMLKEIEETQDLQLAEDAASLLCKLGPAMNEDIVRIKEEMKAAQVRES